MIVGYFVPVSVMSSMAFDGFLHIHDEQVEQYCNDYLSMANMTENIEWPGCGFVRRKHTRPGSNLFGPGFDLSNCNGACVGRIMLRDFSSFNRRYGGKLVSYTSRPAEGIETIQLTGWWLPAPKHNAQTPRIVIQHGFTTNSNYHRAMFFAYQLRKLGFSVLSNNLRDHCYSGDSKERLVQWGHAYPYDTLGAWDYAVNDPDNIMGGALDPSKVGVLGFSMGAFITSIIFGLEGRVPAVWLDSPPFTPKSGFLIGFHKALQDMGIGFFSGLVVDDVWNSIEAAAKSHGVDINLNIPANSLPKGPDAKRPVFLVGNEDDTWVPFSDVAKMTSLLNSFPEKYNLVEAWELKGKCNGEDHCEDHIRIPEEYEDKLCGFWSAVFGLDKHLCQHKIE